MIAWIRRLLRRPEPKTPDIGPFVQRTRASRADAIEERRASERVTRQLRAQNANFMEQELLGRLGIEGGRTDDRRH